MTASSATAAPDDRIPLVLRLYHGALAASFVGAWALESAWREAHECLGYILAGLLLWRLFYGLSGQQALRFATFIVGPRRLWRYASDLCHGRAALRIGYNPLAGWAIAGQMLLLGALACSGHWLTTDTFWGNDALQSTHALLVDAMWVMIVLHLGGVTLASLRSRRVLPLAMLSGRRYPH